MYIVDQHLFSSSMGLLRDCDFADRSFAALIMSYILWCDNMFVLHHLRIYCAHNSCWILSVAGLWAAPTLWRQFPTLLTSRHHGAEDLELEPMNHILTFQPCTVRDQAPSMWTVITIFGLLAGQWQRSSSSYLEYLTWLARQDIKIVAKLSVTIK